MCAMSEHDQLRRSWVANASSWRDAVRNGQIESRRLVTDAAIVDAVLEAHPRTLLDLGCGEGWLARALSSHGIDVTGVDASEPLIEAAQALGGARSLAISYEELIRNPAAAGTAFDVIVANFSLLDDRAEPILRAMATLLPSDGRLIVQTVHPAFACGDRPYADGWRTETFAGFPGEWPEAMPWYFRTIESWSRAFAGAGLAIAQVREPVHPGRGTPASLLFVCVTGRSPAS